MPRKKADKRDREFNAEVYRAAAEERLNTLKHLQFRGFHTLALYLAGVAVESMFRAYRYRIDSSFDSRHDLYELSKAAKFIEIVPRGLIDEYESALLDVASMWSNNHRFRSDAAMRAFLRRAELNRGIKGRLPEGKCESGDRWRIYRDQYWVTKMAKLIDQVDKALRTEFPGAVTELEVVDGKIGGYLLWPKFVGVGSVGRVCQLSAAMRHYLGKDYRKKVSVILPVTPREMKVMREETARPENH